MTQDPRERDRKFEDTKLSPVKQALLERIARGGVRLPKAPARTPTATITTPSTRQRQMWLVEKMQAGSSLHNQAFVVRISGPLDVRSLEAAIQDVVVRHETLRTGFEERDDLPVAILHANLTASLPVTDVVGETDVARAVAALGRGGAWVARATDPIAIARNPAGLAGQPARASVRYDLPLRRMCFSRVKAAGDVTEDGVAPGGRYPRVCDSGAPIPIGYVPVTAPLSGRFSIGGGIVTPSGVPRIELPTFTGGAPSPQRYLLLESTTLMAIPTVSAACEVLEGVRIGASLGWGIAWVRTAAAAPGVLEEAMRPVDNDVKVRVTALDAFVPRATFGSHWSPSKLVELGASFTWSDAIDARGDARTEANAFTARAASGDRSRVAHGDTSRADCGRPGANACGDGGNAQVTIPLPASAALGVRFRLPRRAARSKRDPIDEDVFDLEIDATWSGNSSIDRIGLRFPGEQGVGTIPVPGTAGNLPPNADSLRRYRDVVGLRLGGDAVVIPRRLSLRAGAFVESRAAVPGYVGVEALSGQRVGLSVGATARIPAPGGAAFDVSVGYLRMFVADVVTEVGSAGISSVAGTAPYRTPWPVSLGRLAGGLDVLHLGMAYRF